MPTHKTDMQEIATCETELPGRAGETLLVATGEDTTPTGRLRLEIDDPDHSPTIENMPIVLSPAPFTPAVPVRPEEPVAPAAPRSSSRTPKPQHNQRYAEILQEIRVAQTGVQFLLGFLMTLAFTPRFTELSVPQRDTYVAALMLAFAAAALLTAPAPFHRLVTRRGLKGRLVEISSRLALGGLTLLMLSMNLALLLVLDVVLGFRGAELLSGIALSGFLSLWFGMPLWYRITHDQPR